MTFRTRFDRRKVAIHFEGEVSRTKPSFADECDVNKIMDRYKRTGQLPALVKGDPVYGDFSEVTDYLTSLERVRVAEEAFLALPAAVRKECDNNPAVFLERVKDPTWARDHKLALPPEAVPEEPSKGAGKAPKGSAPSRPGKAPAKDSEASDAED